MNPSNTLQQYGVVAPEIALASSGLDFLRGMLAGAHPAPPFARETDMWLVEAEQGRVVFEAQASSRFYNPMGTVHGGWIATLLDSAMGCAVQSVLRAGQTFTTIEMKTVFVKAAYENSGRLRCVGTTLHTGSRVASAEAKVFDAEGRLMAYGSESCLVMSAPARAA